MGNGCFAGSTVKGGPKGIVKGPNARGATINGDADNGVKKTSEAVKVIGQSFSHIWGKNDGDVEVVTEEVAEKSALKATNNGDLNAEVKSDASNVGGNGSVEETGYQKSSDDKDYVVDCSESDVKNGVVTEMGPEEREEKGDGGGGDGKGSALTPDLLIDIANIPEEKEDSGDNSKNMASFGKLQMQKPAPCFQGTAVVNGEFKEISLEDYKGKYVVFFFYPLDFTFVCPTEIIAFSDSAEEFRKIGCEVVACSTDSHFSHFAWVSTPRKQGGLGDMSIPLLADKNGEIAKAYGVYKEDEGIAYRGLFIIDGKQNLRQITINDIPVGRSVEETLRLVQAFQFTDKYGEVCPAGWKPGQKTIKPDVAASKEYFEGN